MHETARNRKKKSALPLLPFLTVSVCTFFVFIKACARTWHVRECQQSFQFPENMQGRRKYPLPFPVSLPYVLFPCFRVLSVCFSNAFCVRVPYLRSHRRCSVETMLFCRKKICGYKVVVGKEFANQKKPFQLFHPKVFSSKVLTARGEFRPLPTY